MTMDYKQVFKLMEMMKDFDETRTSENDAEYRKLVNFMVQYEAQRVLVEVIFESLPQTIIQTILFFRCADSTCGFEPNEEQDFLLFKLSPGESLLLSLIISAISLLRLAISVYITTQSMGITFRQYFQHLLALGSGLDFSAITSNEATELFYQDYHLSDAQVEEIVVPLKNNKSVERFHIDWDNLSEKSVKLLLDTGHQAVKFSYIAKDITKEFPHGDPLVVVCEKGRLKDLQMFIDSGTVDNINRIGRDSVPYENHDNSSYYKRTPLGIAVRYEQFEIVKYLLSLPNIDVGVPDDDGTNPIHYAAAYSKINVDILTLLLNHKTFSKHVLNKRGRYRSSIIGLSALSCAKYNNNYPVNNDIIQLLKSKGAKHNYCDMQLFCNLAKGPRSTFPKLQTSDWFKQSFS
eukprot:g14784.t1